ncbi:MAG: transglycosylase SLT domain-containing protein [Arsenophonus endosymbiont of Dermacentor nuttalli]
MESNFRANTVSKSNVIGLMQVKASTAGRDAYRLQGKVGQPTTSQLKDPAINIDVGTAYISFIQDKHLSGIRDPKVLYYIQPLLLMLMVLEHYYEFLIRILILQSINLIS